MAAPVPAPLPTVPLINWMPLHERARPSVFIILLTPYDQTTTRDTAGYVGTKDPEELNEIFKAECHTETGIAARRRGDYLYIATSAHIIDFLYQAKTHPITVEEVNKHFEISVTCSHAESQFIERGFVGERTYTLAEVCGINCSIDLMMVRVDLRELAVRTVGERRRIPCTANHPPVQFSTSRAEGTQCMMYSWPAFRPFTMTTGLQGPNRGPVALMSSNPIGYNLELIEASVGSEAGSSGAPLYNTNQRVIGIWHGGSSVHSHFIPSKYILNFIRNNKNCPLPKSQDQQDAPPHRDGDDERDPSGKPGTSNASSKRGPSGKPGTSNASSKRTRSAV
ncbi:uncharacterized protein LOC123398367 [Hordeum vulgare subsp. vulgare]|uniref:Serine protease n=1 Tax=Hordeum vulgare subsp. vulgare TaxID=112509 RepID=M0XES2_HORVV|nr:uncharacterized protein LOC123398367 [Hordeum vulgare subsp. vulgare]